MIAAATLRRLLALDQAVFLRLRALERPRLTPLMRALTALGDPQAWGLQGALLVLLAPRAHAVVRLGLAVGAATLLVQVLKRFCRRARPSAGIAGFRALAADPDAFSFPSGHTAVACAAAIALCGVVPGLGALELTLAGGIALSRVYLGAHYPLDVTIGALLGLACGGAVATLG